VRHVRSLFPDVPLFALAGGMHLRSSSAARLAWTVEELALQNVRLVAPAHCTGREAKAALCGRWGPRYREVSAGTRINLEAN
jgi:7,8-dihydropterin-6-yl-methyl-4-(beta-D-ribofuranosyl)aminobenzene 5'-phosphate synthase